MFKWFFGKKEEIVPAPIKTAPSPSMLESSAQLENDLYKYIDAGYLTDVTPYSLDKNPCRYTETKTPKKKQKNKFKIAHYASHPDSEIRHFIEPSLFKTRTIIYDNGDSGVQVFYKNHTGELSPSVTLIDNDNCMLTLTIGTQVITIESSEALELSLALKKYHEMTGEGDFVKVKNGK